MNSRVWKTSNLIRSLALIVAIPLSGCQGPLLLMSGGELHGIEATASGWDMEEGLHLIQLETRPSVPYSVNLGATVIDGNLYIDAAERRRWHDHIKKDPRVRFKLGSLIYSAEARVVHDESIIERFLPGRTIYHLIPLDR